MSDLPPLPERFDIVTRGDGQIPVWHLDDMKAYAREAVRAAVEQAKVEKGAPVALASAARAILAKACAVESLADELTALEAALDAHPSTSEPVASERVRYPHLMICNADHYAPIGCDMCICVEAVRKAAFPDPVEPVASPDVQALYPNLEQPDARIDEQGVRELCERLNALSLELNVAGLWRAEAAMHDARDALRYLAVAPVASKSVEDCMAVADCYAAKWANRSGKWTHEDADDARAALQAAIVAIDEERQFKAALVRELLPYQERAVKAETAIIAYGDAQWNAAIEAAAEMIASAREWNETKSVEVEAAVRGLKLEPR